MKVIRFALVPAGMVFGLGAEWAALHRGPLEEPLTGEVIRLAAADLVVGWTLIACGLVAWSRRPQSRIGALLAATGFSWFLGTFAGSSIDAVADFGAVFVTLHRGPLLHAILSYPSGRLGGRFERAVVALAYAAAAVVDVGESPEATIALGAVVVVAAVRVYLRSAGPLRRARAPALAAAVALVAVLVVGSVLSLAGAEGDRAVLWGYQAVIFAIAVGFLLNLLGGRWTEATVTGLVVDLGELREEGMLRDRLASALGDPSLVVGYWVPDAGDYLDEAGRSVELPEAGSEREVTVVRDGGEPVAALVHDAGLLEDRELVESVAAAARIAVSNARLRAEIRRQVDEIEASRRRIVEAADTQRRRLERELQEGAERRLARVQAVLETVEGNDAVDAMLGEARGELERARADLGEFARGIHPRVLTEGGLPAALADLARTAPFPVEVKAPEERFLPPIEVAAYFVCSEALANVGKYAQASRAMIDVTWKDGRLVVAIEDDGVGGASLDKGSGLRGLADRVEALGGRLTVESRPGRGTRVVAELPVNEPS